MDYRESIYSTINQIRNRREGTGIGGSGGRPRTDGKNGDRNRHRRGFGDSVHCDGCRATTYSTINQIQKSVASSGRERGIRGNRNGAGKQTPMEKHERRAESTEEPKGKERGSTKTAGTAGTDSASEGIGSLAKYTGVRCRKSIHAYGVRFRFHENAKVYRSSRLRRSRKRPSSREMKRKGPAR